MKLIPLSQQGKHKGKYVAQVDDEDYDRLMKYRWCVITVRDLKYAGKREVINGKSVYTKMHRDIMGITDRKIQVDHKFGDTLNNQKYNLRIATDIENKWNTKSRKNSSSTYKGVSWSKRHSKWKAQINIKGKNTHLGLFYNEIAAAKMYDEVARKTQGQWAKLNFP